MRTSCIIMVTGCASCRLRFCSLRGLSQPARSLFTLILFLLDEGCIRIFTVCFIARYHIAESIRGAST